MTNYHFTPLTEIEADHNKKRIMRVAGYISSAQHLISKKGTHYGRFKLVDYHGEHEFTLFTNDYIRFKDMLIQDNKLMMTVIYQNRWNDETQWECKIQSMMLLEEVKNTLTKKLSIEISLQKLDEAFVDIIRKYAEVPGKCALGIQVKDETTQEMVRLQQSFKKITLSDEFIDALNKMEGVIYSVQTI
jgi:DNA polymerase-3 subunit alpha